MANRKVDRDRIIELSIKQTKEDKLYIITGIIKSLSEDNVNNKLQLENENLKKELDLYKKDYSKIVREYVNNELKKQKQ